MRTNLPGKVHLIKIYFQNFYQKKRVQLKYFLLSAHLETHVFVIPAQAGIQ